MNEKKLSFREALGLFRRGLKIVRENNPGLLLATFLCSAVKAATPYVGVYLSAQIVGELAGGRDPRRLWALVLIALISAAVLALLNGGLSHYKTYKEDPLYHAFNHVYAEKMSQMDFPVLDDQHTHDLRSQVWQNNNWNGWGLYKTYGEFRDLTESAVGVLSAMALTVSLFFLPVPESAGAFTFLNHPLTSLGVLLLLAALAWLSSACDTKSFSYFVAHAEDNKMANRYFSFFGFVAFHERKRALDIRTYDQQKVFDQYSRTTSSFSVGGVLSQLAKGRMGLLRFLSAALSMVLLGLTYVFVCLKAWAGAFGVGSVAQYVGAISALAQGFSLLFYTLGDMKNNGAFLKTTFEFLDLPNSMYQGSLTTEKRSDRQYDLEFRDVSFRYPHTDAWALRHVDLKFRVGQRLAVVGENGSGKTTFIKLLCRLYDPQEGEILLNGIDIRKYRYDDYMKIFSVAFQDFQLLSQPLGSNVAGAVSYDRAKAERSLRDAGFDERASRMKNGLDTYLYRDFEEDGVEVSGGEAQKIAIARALYKDAPFIILDEPTAALDPLAEAEIYEKFGSIAGDRTTVCISHRLSSCKFCDEILVFDHGQIVQQGSHEGLLENEAGKYAQLWNAQAQYYEKAE